MRTMISTILGLFLASALIGCGGTPVTQAPEGAKDGPPPGSSPELTKVIEKKKSR